MTAAPELDVDFCRSHFPELAGDWVFMENAGGTLVPRQVIDRLNHYASHCQVQPGEGYPASDEAQRMIDEGRSALAALIGAKAEEIVVGPSTTSNVYVLSHALAHLFAPGDEIVVTNQDHEANNGAWRRMAEAHGLTLREWKMSADTDDLELEDLEPLLNDRTRLVCFTHCSNIVGLVHDARAIVKRVHAAGAMTCVDGVAYAPHRRVDVKELDTDFYLYSPYKTFGPHLGVLYGKPEALAKTRSQNHYFVPEGDYQRSLCPGGPNHELTAAAGGIAEYFAALHAHHFPGDNAALPDRIGRLYGLFAAHENAMADRIGTYLASKPGVRLVGQGAAGRRERASVFAFVVEGRKSPEIAAALRSARIGAHADDFYAARCIDAVGARAQGGVVRVSLTHYNDQRDVDRLLDALDNII